MDTCNEMSNKEWADNVGETNLVNLYNIDRFSKDEIFISVVEYYIVTDIRTKGVPSWIQNLLDSNYFEPDNLFDRNGHFLMRHGGRTFSSVVDLYSFVYNATRISAAVDLGNTVKMAYDSVFGVSSKNLYRDEIEVCSHRDKIFENILPGSVKTRDGVYSFFEKIHIKTCRATS